MSKKQQTMAKGQQETADPLHSVTAHAAAAQKQQRNHVEQKAKSKGRWLSVVEKAEGNGGVQDEQKEGQKSC